METVFLRLLQVVIPWLSGNLQEPFGLGLLKGKSGSLYVDGFTEISFSSIK